MSLVLTPDLGAFDAGLMVDRLARLDAALVDETAKGLPPLGIPFADVGGAGLSLLLGDLPLPTAVLRDTALSRNRAWMAKFLSMSGVRIAPHGKTPMAPRIAQMQMQDGAWGITAATAQHARIFADFGIRRIILANQLVGAANIQLVLDLLTRPDPPDLYVLIDSLTGARLLAEAHRAAGASLPIQILIEVGAVNGRTGVRSHAAGLELASDIAALTPNVVLRGIEAYEGIFGDHPFPKREELAQAMTGGVYKLAKECAEQGLFAPGPILLTAGGTEFYDFAASDLAQGIPGHQVIPVIRSGCYVTHDHLSFDRMFRKLLARRPDLTEIQPEMTPALEVWAAVQSMPEPGLAFVTMGKRDVSYDVEMPVPVHWFCPSLHDRPVPIPPGHAVQRLNDQHAFLTLPDRSPLQIGDMVGFGVSHVCTTFDKWRVILRVDDDYRVTGAVRTLF